MEEVLTTLQTGDSANEDNQKFSCEINLMCPTCVERAFSRPTLYTCLKCDALATSCNQTLCDVQISCFDISPLQQISSHVAILFIPFYSLIRVHHLRSSYITIKLQFKKLVIYITFYS